MTEKKIIQLSNIHKSFYLNTPNELEVLHGIDLTVREGEFVSIVICSHKSILCGEGKLQVKELSYAED